ncbi:hypothetical protein CBE01nite_41850 [Clostridium beijerinckii]|nr:hypothetical protein CBE01nite_41850 [Clostridium beijerinckii]
MYTKDIQTPLLISPKFYIRYSHNLAVSFYSLRNYNAIKSVDNIIVVYFTGVNYYKGIKK